MQKSKLEELAKRVEAASNADSDLIATAANVLRESFPTAAAAGHVPDDIAASTDAIVELVIAALPGWHFSIHGRARSTSGSWSCSLRRSDVRDDDELIGVGEAQTLSLATLAAVLRVAARQ